MDPGLGPNPDQNNWTHESGFLTDLAKHLIEGRASLPDDILIGIWRELDAVTRLLHGELFWTNRGQPVARVAHAAGISYGKTPISKWGYIPPVEVSIRLSCMIEVDKERLEKRAAGAKRTTDLSGLDLSGLDDLDF